MLRYASSVAIAAIMFLTAPATPEQGGRQYYGKWEYNKEKNYHYRQYNYKVNASDKEYQHQYCIYYKNDAKVNNKWCYFYSPKTKLYWARYPTVNNETYRVHAEKGQEAWSELPAKYRNEDIYQIDNKVWPAPPANYCPTIPESMDGAQMQSPPPDLPQ